MNLGFASCYLLSILVLADDVCSVIPFGHETHQRQPLPQQGYDAFWKMFNARQLLVHAQLLRAILNQRKRREIGVIDALLGVFQQYLRNQSTFCFWNPQRDTLEPQFSNNNYHPKCEQALIAKVLLIGGQYILTSFP